MLQVKRSSCAFLLLAFSLGAPAQEVQTERKDVTICEVLRNLVEFDNQQVTLQGEYVVTSEVFLRSSNCSSQVLLDDLNYVGGIALLGSDDFRRLKRPAVFTTDDSVFKAMAEAYRKAQQERKKLIVTLEGRIDSFPWFRKPQGRNDVRRGYGHLNSFPAQLVVERLRNMRYE